MVPMTAAVVCSTKSLPQDMKIPEVHRLNAGSAVVYSSRCPEKEGPNEDTAAVVQLEDDSLVLVVADGMGGALAGEKASELTVDAIVEELRTYSGDDDQRLRAAIMNGIENANRAVQQMGLGAATTLAAVQVRGRAVRPFHVGDSLVLIVGSKGKIKLQTIAHSPVGYAVEAGVLDEAEAMHHEDRHIVSNVVGAEDMRIEVGAPFEMSPRDTLVIASDGLSDNLHVEEIVELVRKGPLKRAVRDLASVARGRMTIPRAQSPSKPDDLTILAFRPGPAATPGRSGTVPAGDMEFPTR
jgi:serine/threonine protein phosphatase PrpC